MRNEKKIVSAFFLLLFCTVTYGQNGSVGINNVNPNPNAALHISSQNGDQGLLIPNLSSAKRLSLVLDNNDNGLVVFDGDEGQFYFWYNGEWLAFRDGIVDDDSDISNEIQDLSLTGNNLTITNNGSATTIDLSPYLDDTDTKLTEAEVDGFVSNNGYLSAEVDGSTTNEIQDLSLTGNNLTITNNGSATTIDLSPYLDDTNTQLTETQVDAFVSNNGYLSAEVDGSTTNEIQDLSLMGNNLTITNNGSATTIDLSPYLDDTDTKLTEAEVDGFVSNNGYLSAEVDGSTSNEIQDLSLTGNNLTITNNGAATTIDLSPYLDDTDTKLTEAEVDGFVSNNGYLSAEVDGSTSNEIQDLSLTGNNLTITNNGAATTIDLSPYLDDTNTQLNETQVDAFVSNNGYLTTEVDGSTTNEIQDLSLTGNNLTITNNGAATTIDLSPYLDDTNTQLNETQVDAFVSNNGYLSAEVDGSTTNEIQDLSLTGNNLTITNNGAATTIDLSPYLDDTNTQLNETQVDAFVSNNGYLSAEVDGSTTNEIQDLSLTGNNLTITNNGSATTIDLSPYLDDTNTQLNETQVDAFVSNNGYLSAEVDGSTTNEIQDLSLTGNNLTITNNGSATTIDLSPYLDDTNTQLNETQVDAFVSNNGYLSAEVDGSTTNEIQDLSLTGNNLTITNNGAATTIDLSPYLDDTNTQLNETQVDAFVSNNGYLITEVDGSTTNEIQDLSLTGNNLTITNNGAATTIDLSPYLNTDTKLSETEVDAFVSNNGYLSAEVDGSINNEIQDLSLTGNNLTITNNGSATTIDLSPYLDDTNTQLNETQVDAFVSNNGYLTTEVDGSTTNEIQDLSLTGNNLTITNNGSATTIDLSPYLDDTDTQLNETQVDAFVSNNGYLITEVDGSTTNEIQDLSLTGNNLTITNNGAATTIDLSPYLDNTDTQLTETQVDAFVSNNGYLTTEVDGSTTNEIQDLSLTGNNLTITNNGAATTIDLSPYLDDTNTQLNETQVDAFVSNNGYLTTVTSANITDATITASDINASVAGNGLAGGAGTPLSINLSASSGLEIATDQLQMEDVFADPGTRVIVGGGSVTVDAKGRLTAVSGVPSDIRLKEEIYPLKDMLQKLDSIDAYTFFYKDGAFDKEIQYGVIAQELEKVFPELVEENNGYKSIKFGFLVPILLSAVKEQQEMIDALKAENEQQKQEASNTDQRLKALESQMQQILQTIDPK